MHAVNKFLREFFRLFGENNALYKKFRDSINNEPINRIKKQCQTIENKILRLDDINAYFLAYTHFKQHYGIEIPTEAAYHGNRFEYVQIKVKDIKRYWDGKIYSLKECSPYKYLETKDKKIYQKYIQKHIDINYCSKNTAWNVKKFDELFKSIKKYGYDPQKSVICINDDYTVIDGQHRACCLLFLHGGDYKINVIKVSRI